MARISGVMRIDESFFLKLREYKEDNINDIGKVKWAIDKIVMGYALVSQGEAQKRSLGPQVTPGSAGGSVRFGVRGRHLRNMAIPTVGAWKIPVRRITGAYFEGWHISQVGHAVWLLTNVSREAYFIEFGINHHSTTGLFGPSGQRVRVRRPVMKLSVLEAMRKIEATGADANIIVNIFKEGTMHSPELLPGIPSPVRGPVAA
jgi:hypothetical protein